MGEDIEDRRLVIVTGASRGIGNELCHGLAAENYIIVGIGRSSYKSDKFEYQICDLEDQAAIIDFVSHVKAKYNRIDGLVNCAGISIGNTTTIEAFEKTLKTNLVAPYLLTCEVVKCMKEKGSGSIVNVTSIAAVQGFPNNPGYVASKGGLNSLTRSMAIDYAEFNIRVNNILPGYIRTEMTNQSYLNNELRLQREGRTIMGRWGGTSEILGGVKFLLSDDSSYVTGSDFIIDGGWTARGL